MTVDQANRNSPGISPQSLRHNDMRLEALKAHTELRALSGNNPKTALGLPVLFAVQ